VESDKWIRKLLALLVKMGFELQAPQSHRKVIYKGDKLKKPCDLVIQSHAKDSSKRDIMSYIKRTLRAAGAPADMISQLDSLPISFVPDGMSIQQIDDELYSALSKRDSRLVAEIAVELGKAISDQGAADYTIKAFMLLDEEIKRQNEVYNCYKMIRDMLCDIFEKAFMAYTERYGYLEFTLKDFRISCSEFDADICDKYSLYIDGADKTDDELILKGMFTGDLGNHLNIAGYDGSFQVSFFGNADDRRCVISSANDISGFDLGVNLNLSSAAAHELVDNIAQERVLIYLR